VKIYSWAIPSREALDRLAEAGRVVEIGGGRGYWAGVVNALGGNIDSYDKKPPAGQLFHPVMKGGAEKAGIGSYEALFICWPPFDTPMAAESLRNFKGNLIFYVGEEAGGCTGDLFFHQQIIQRYTLVKRIKIPNWEGIRDYFFEFHRNL